MGYTTDFKGKFKLNKELDDKTYEFLVKLSNTRRMWRKLGSEYGVDGEFYVDGGGDFGQGREDNIVNYNKPPSTQPGLWCQWCPTEDRLHIEWNGAEKFYHYVEWIEYITDNFLIPRGYVLNGEVEWHGEDDDDQGIIVATNNEITTKRGRIVYE